MLGLPQIAREERKVIDSDASIFGICLHIYVANFHYEYIYMNHICWVPTFLEIYIFLERHI
jgi:hypothetical protein